MSHAIVIALHLIWTAYGWWLPNDPRGSGSKVTRNDVIAELGELHFGRKKIQPACRDVRRFYEQASDVLKHPLLTFDADARAEIAISFADVIKNHQYTCYACAIMPYLDSQAQTPCRRYDCKPEGSQSRSTLFSETAKLPPSHLDLGWRLESLSRPSERGKTHHQLHQPQPNRDPSARPALAIR